jgi:hypothetical protein
LLPAAIEKYTTISKNDRMAMPTSEVGRKHHHLLMCNPEMFMCLMMLEVGGASESG